MGVVKSELIYYQLTQAVLCIAGFLISAFAVFVERSKSNDASYVALCDINSWVSCSAVLTSQYSKGFGLIGPLLSEESVFNLPNSIYGLIFFNVQLALGLIHNLFASRVLFFMSLFTMPVIVYLAGILVFILRDFCLVCVSTYFVNLLLLCVHFKLYKYYIKRSQKKKY